MPQRYAHEVMYGERMQPALKTRLPEARTVPLRLDALDPAKPCHIVMELTDADGMQMIRNFARDIRGIEPVLVNAATARATLPRLKPTARVELVAPLMCGYGRALQIQINGRWTVRVGRWLRSQPIETLHSFHVPLDPRYLRPGDNTFRLTVPAMPPQRETMFGSSDIVVVPPGLSLRIVD